MNEGRGEWGEGAGLGGIPAVSAGRAGLQSVNRPWGLFTLAANCQPNTCPLPQFIPPPFQETPAKWQI